MSAGLSWLLLPSLLFAFLVAMAAAGLGINWLLERYFPDEDA